MTLRNGLDSLFRPENSVRRPIGRRSHRPAKLNSHDPQAVVNNTTVSAKPAKAVDVPTILTSVIAAALLPDIPIDHAGGSCIACMWERPFLKAPVQIDAV